MQPRAMHQIIAPQIHGMTDPKPALSGSYGFISDQMAQTA